ncbi:uncharacterized protein LOC123000435 [Ursus arctos]|uniref:uncharacterized protein LOC123000435 n=1 Tax=Ursus arctos TaxID=9644 RepID=UPI001CF82E84|nr:uncharacterized protein LOC123000435 [Ursus arctos]
MAGRKSTQVLRRECRGQRTPLWGRSHQLSGRTDEKSGPGTGTHLRRGRSGRRQRGESKGHNCGVGRPGSEVTGTERARRGKAVGGQCPRYPEGTKGSDRGPRTRDGAHGRGCRDGAERERSPAGRERPQTALTQQARPYLEMRQHSQRLARTALSRTAAACALPLPFRALPLAEPPRPGGGACAVWPRGAGDASCAGAMPVASETARCFRGRGSAVPGLAWASAGRSLFPLLPGGAALASGGWLEAGLLGLVRACSPAGVWGLTVTGAPGARFSKAQGTAAAGSGEGQARLERCRPGRLWAVPTLSESRALCGSFPKSGQCKAKTCPRAVMAFFMQMKTLSGFLGVSFLKWKWGSKRYHL